MRTVCKSAVAFFDPFVERDYYYAILPLLPLLYSRIYVYYPSDWWIWNSPRLSSMERRRYFDELCYWIKKDVIVPVVKGGYPTDNDIAAARLHEDAPTDGFRDWLRTDRDRPQSSWIIRETRSTESGHAAAEQIIQQHGADVLRSILNVELDCRRIPELAFYYAGGRDGSNDEALRQTVASYENDDLFRREHEVGEYMLPPTSACQYAALQQLLRRSDGDEILCSNGILMGVDQHWDTSARRGRGGWLDRRAMEQWRDMGLHGLLHEVCFCEARSANTGIPGKGRAVAVLLDELRGSIPGDVARALVDDGLLWKAITAIGGVQGYVSGGVIQGLLGAGAGKVIGKVGSRIIRAGLVNIEWERIICELIGLFGPEPGPALFRSAIGFNDVVVFGDTEK